MHELLEPPVLRTPRLLLRTAVESDIPVILKYLSENREHFAAWGPPKPPNFETHEHWQGAFALSTTTTSRIAPFDF